MGFVFANGFVKLIFVGECKDMCLCRLRARIIVVRYEKASMCAVNYMYYCFLK